MSVSFYNDSGEWVFPFELQKHITNLNVTKEEILQKYLSEDISIEDLSKRVSKNEITKDRERTIRKVFLEKRN